MEDCFGALGHIPHRLDGHIRARNDAACSSASLPCFCLESWPVSASSRSSLHEYERQTWSTVNPPSPVGRDRRPDLPMRQPDYRGSVAISRRQGGGWVWKERN